MHVVGDNQMIDYTDMPPKGTARTDGCAAIPTHAAILTLPGYTPHQPFFTPLQQFVMNRNTGECLDTHEQLSRFLDSPRVNERTDDDKTLVLAALIEK